MLFRRTCRPLAWIESGCMGIEGFGVNGTKRAERCGEIWVRSGAGEVGVYGVSVYS